jgi:hypothetical protein
MRVSARPVRDFVTEPMPVVFDDSRTDAAHRQQRDQCFNQCRLAAVLQPAHSDYGRFGDHWNMIHIARRAGKHFAKIRKSLKIPLRGLIIRKSPCVALFLV